MRRRHAATSGPSPAGTSSNRRLASCSSPRGETTTCRSLRAAETSLIGVLEDDRWQSILRASTGEGLAPPPSNRSADVWWLRSSRILRYDRSFSVLLSGNQPNVGRGSAGRIGGGPIAIWASECSARTRVWGNAPSLAQITHQDTQYVCGSFATSSLLARKMGFCGFGLSPPPLALTGPSSSAVHTTPSGVRWALMKAGGEPLGACSPSAPHNPVLKIGREHDLHPRG
jgi:hypothetical protein